MKFKVKGAFKSTGADVNLIIEANDQCHAERIVNEMGILFSSLQPEISEQNIDKPNVASVESILPKYHNMSPTRQRQLFIACAAIVINLVLLFVPPWKGIEGRSKSWDIYDVKSKPWYDEPKSFVGFYGIFRKSNDEIKNRDASVYSADWAIAEYLNRELNKEYKKETEESLKRQMATIKKAKCKRVILGEINVHLQIIFCTAVLFIGALWVIIVGLYTPKISRQNKRFQASE